MAEAISSFKFTAGLLMTLRTLGLYTPEGNNQFYFDVIDMTNRLKHRHGLRR